jgi:hypothetical protein
MTTSAPLRIAAGALVWATHFGVVYGTTALACARGRADVVPAVVIGATLAGIAAAVLLVAGSYPHRERFAHWLAAAVAASAILAMAWEALAALLAPPCR